MRTDSPAKVSRCVTLEPWSCRGGRRVCLEVATDIFLSIILFSDLLFYMLRRDLEHGFFSWFFIASEEEPLLPLQDSSLWDRDPTFALFPPPITCPLFQSRPQDNKAKDK
jgi:hypothetical protein